MHPNLKKPLFILLSITSILCSRIMFVFIDDPEGPNLLVVFVLALIIYFTSLAFYFFNPLINGKFKNIPTLPYTNIRVFPIILLIQLIVTYILYFILN